MLDTQEIYLMRLADDDGQDCDHPDSERWPFFDGWEICGVCGAIVRPRSFIPFLEEHFMAYGVNNVPGRN